MEEKEFKVIQGGKSEQLQKLEEQIAKSKEPKIIKDLELSEGEVYLGQLKKADQFQVLIRHLNVIEHYLANIFMNSNSQTICLMEIAKKQGVEIDKILNFGNDRK